ncbi:unnamed protein product [Discosporangium mesarthrocarpum]
MRHSRFPLRVLLPRASVLLLAKMTVVLLVPQMCFSLNSVRPSGARSCRAVLPSCRVPPLSRNLVCFSAPQDGIREEILKNNMSLEDELDALDDMVMDRPPGVGRERVKVFGAWLDADVAGRKAGKGNRAQALLERAKRGEELNNKEKAEVFYEEAIACMGKGKYDTASEMLSRAVKYAGEDSRRGGEFKLWAVQALQGVGKDAEAIHLLKSMKHHSDKDVRKVSTELLFIAQAPKMELKKEDRVEFPDVSHINEAFDKNMWKELSKPRADYDPNYKEQKGYVLWKVAPAPKRDYLMLVSIIVTGLAFSFVYLHVIGPSPRS